MSTPRDSARRSRLTIVIAAVAVAVVVLGIAGVAYMFGGSAPAAVSLSTADPTSASSADAALASAPSSASSAVSSDPLASASGSSAPSSASASSATAASTGTSGSADGTWNVDTSIGSFSDFSSSFVGYRVAENLANVGSTTAVGRTPKVTGSLTLQGSTITATKITADLTALQSDKAMRDGQLTHQALETSQFPTATFELTTPIQLATQPAEGATWSVTAHGKLTLHGVTKDVAIPLQAKLSGGVVTVVGSTEIAFADYAMNPPQSMMVLSVADRGTLELQLHFRHA